MDSQWLQLKNNRVEVTVNPDFGARVTSFIDRRSGRDWLVAGDCIGSPLNQAVFGGQEARGWDECFPTVAPCVSSHWGRDLRDHGDLWARPWNCRQSEETIFGEYVDPDFRFERELTLLSNGLATHYKVTNIGSKPLPYLWSQHCLLACHPEERILLQGIDLTQLSNEPAYLDQIFGMESGYFHKSYSWVQDHAEVGIEGHDGGIRFSWSEQDLPCLGLWLDYGGWPFDEPVHQVALEATTAPADDLAQAINQKHERWIAPGEHHHWKVIVNFTPSL